MQQRLNLNITAALPAGPVAVMSLHVPAGVRIWGNGDENGMDQIFPRTGKQAEIAT